MLIYLGFYNLVFGFDILNYITQINIMEELELKHITPYLEHKVNVQYKGIINGKVLGIWHREQDSSGFLSPETRPIPDEIIGDKTGLIKKVEIYLKYWKLLIGNGHKSIYPSDFGKTAFLILRPLSDLTKPIKVEGYNDGKEFVPIEQIPKEIGGGWCDAYDESYDCLLGDYSRISMMPHEFIQLLYSWLFAIDIPEGTWSDINQINKN